LFAWVDAILAARVRICHEGKANAPRLTPRTTMPHTSGVCAMLRRLEIVRLGESSWLRLVPAQGGVMGRVTDGHQGGLIELLYSNPPQETGQ